MPSEGLAEAQRDLRWHAEVLRLTGLFPTNDAGGPGDHWIAVVGDEPTVSSSRKGGETRLEGPYADCKLSLVLRPERVDWLLSPQEAPEPDESPMATTMDFSSALPLIDQIAVKWADFANCPPFQRIAVGAVLLAPTGSAESGYTQLSAYLPSVKVDAAHSRDLSYQINRPRVSRCLGTEIGVNRLSKWSVAVFMAANIVLAGGHTRSRANGRAFACRLELDINTDAEFEGEIDRSLLPKVVKELSSLAEEISREGDQR